MNSRNGVCCWLLSALGILPGATAAVPLTVGTGGTYATIQAAVDAAVASAGNDEIRIRVGTYTEHVLIPDTLTGELVIRGGYDGAFAIQVRNGATSTIISPPANQSGIEAHLIGGTDVSIEDLSVKDAQAEQCAGIDASLAGSANFVLDGVFVRDNVAARSGDTRGAGACISADESSFVDVVRSEFSGNAVQVPVEVDGSAAGGGLSLSCVYAALCIVESTTFRANAIQGGGADTRGGGLDVTLGDGAQFGLYDSLFEQQQHLGTEVDGVSACIVATGTAIAYVTATQFRGSATPMEYFYPKFEVVLAAGGGSKVQMIDSLIAQPDDSPLLATTDADGLLVLGQNTLADGPHEASLYSNSTVAARVYDNLFWQPASVGKGQPYLVGTFELSQNLSAVDPGFLAPSRFDYSLRHGADSPAGDAGFANGHPVGSFDIAGAARVQGPSVDIGAWESSDRIYADRFEP